MPRKDVDIRPGQAFHLPAAREKNLSNLMEILSKKEATDALTAMAKTKDSTWASIKDTVNDLKELATLGTGNLVDRLETTITLKFEEALAPLNNEIDQMVINFLTPINEKLNIVANELAAYVSDFSTGATAGALVGKIASFLGVPGGDLLPAIGSLIGAGIENLILWLADVFAYNPEHFPQFDPKKWMTPEQYAAWLKFMGVVDPLGDYGQGKQEALYELEKGF